MTNPTISEAWEDHKDLQRFLGNAITSAMLAAAMSRKLDLPGIASGAQRGKETLDQMLHAAVRLEGGDSEQE